MDEDNKYLLKEVYTNDKTNLGLRLTSQKEQIEELYKRTDRPSWWMVFLYMVLTSVIGGLGTYINVLLKG